MTSQPKLTYGGDALCVMLAATSTAIPLNHGPRLGQVPLAMPRALSLRQLFFEYSDGRRHPGCFPGMPVVSWFTIDCANLRPPSSLQPLVTRACPAQSRMEVVPLRLPPPLEQAVFPSCTMTLPRRQGSSSTSGFELQCYGGASCSHKYNKESPPPPLHVQVPSLQALVRSCKGACPEFLSLDVSNP
jgi:hypothetical protein